MSRKANPMVIGLFIVGALVLAIAGVLVFGTGKFFEERTEYVLFFKGSIKGLDVGAPVMFRGVKVGSVTDIRLNIDPEKYQLWIPVYIELEPGRARFVGETQDLEDVRKGDNKFMEQLIERGLRAQLQLQSVVTGKLFVALDLFADEPVELVGLETEVPEIPTVKTAFEEIADTATQIIEEIRKMPIEELVKKLLHTVEGIDEVVHSPEFGGSVRSLKQTLDKAAHTVEGIDEVVHSPEFGGSVRSLKKTLDELDKLVRNLNSRIAPVVTDAQKTTRSARSALRRIEEALASLEGTAGEDSELHYELTAALKELSAAARSIRVFTDQLAQHPDAMLRGKTTSGGP